MIKLTLLFILCYCFWFGEGLEIVSTGNNSSIELMQGPNPSKRIGHSWVFDVMKGTPAYFYMNNVHIKDSQWLCFTASIVSGDCDVYVSGDITQPNKANCKKHPEKCLSSTTAHNDIVCLSKSSPQYKSTMYIGSDCVQDSRYIFNAYFDDSTRIYLENVEDFQPLVSQGQIAAVKRSDTYLRFRYEHPIRDGLTISVSPTLGDPDVYVKYGKDDIQVDSSHYTWSSINFGGDVINIDVSDPNFRNGTDGAYQIAVRSFTSEAMFSISATPTRGYNQLLETVPTLGYVKRGQYQYYAFYLASDATDLVIKLDPTTQSADPDIYVARNVSEKRPGSDHWDWKSTKLGAEQVTIDDAKKGYYYIAVKGFTNAAYTVTGFTEYFNLVLQDGRTYTNNIETGVSKMQYFKYFHGDSESGLTVQVTNIQESSGGALTLLMSSDNSRPVDEPGKYDWKGELRGNSAFIHLQNVDVGSYYVGVLNNGNAATNYKISATSDHSTVHLTDGIALLFQTVPKHYYRHFAFDIGKVSDSLIMITANPFEGDTDLFVSTEILQPTKEKCAESNKCWKSETYDSDSVIIDPKNSDIQINGTTFYIGVYGFTRASFEILAHTSNKSMAIHDGDSISSAVLPLHYVYYKFKPEGGPGTHTVRMELQLDDISRDVDIYVSYKNQYPDKTYCEDSENCYKSTMIGNDIVEIPDALSSRTYYIGIYGVNTGPPGPKSYTLYVRSLFHRVQSNAQAVLEYTSKGKIQQIRTTFFQSCEYAIISVTLLSGSTKLYVQNGTTDAGPDNYSWVNDGWPGNSIILERSQLPASPSIQPFSIGVEGIENSDYFIATSCGNTYQHSSLTHGVPRFFSAPKDDYMFLRISLPGIVGETLKVDWAVYIHPRGGNVGIYIDQTETKPKADTEYLLASSEGSHPRTIILSHEGEEAIRTGSIFIGTRGIGDVTEFSITVYQIDEPTILTVDQPKLLTFDTFQKSYFQIMNSNHHETLSLVLNSCSDSKALEFYGSLENRKPDKHHNDYESKRSDNPYVQYLSIEYSDEVNNYFFGLQSEEKTDDMFTFVSFYESALPIIKDPIINGQKKLTDKTVKLEIPIAEKNQRFPDRELTYSVYYTELKLNTTVPSKNMRTVCAITKTTKATGDFTIDTKYVNFNIDNIPDLQKVFKANVIVEDGKGMSNAYHPFYINQGIVMPNFEYVCHERVSSDPEVCSGHGKCTAQDHCQCTTKGYTGPNCAVPVCYGIPANIDETCSGAGKCIAPDKCECQKNFFGESCEHKKKGGNVLAVLLPIFFILAFIVFVIVVVIGVILAIVIYKKKSSLKYEKFNDDPGDVSDLDYLDRKGEDGTYEEL